MKDICLGFIFIVVYAGPPWDGESHCYVMSG